MNYDIKYNRVIIFDGSHCLHRNLSIPNNFNMITSKMKRTGGIFGTLRTIYKELKAYNYFPVVVFDGGLSERRLELYPNYKRHADKMLTENYEEKTYEQQLAEEMKREYNTQRKDLIELLPTFGIPTISIKGWEGDDLIYIISKMCKDSIIVSDDKDLLQLIHNPQPNDGRECCVRRAMTDEFWSYKEFREKYDSTTKFIATKAIIGDTSDNIPSSCFQVGEKTAGELFNIYVASAQEGVNFPQTEEELNEICKKYGLSKRKAYLNFDINQFVTNYRLTDLSYVDEEINPEIIEYITNQIDSASLNLDLMNNLLDEYEINLFDRNNFADDIYYSRGLLPIENEKAVINTPKFKNHAKIL